MRKNSVDLSRPQSLKTLSDFDQKSKSSHALSDLSDIESTDIEMSGYEFEVTSIEDAQQRISTVQTQVMNLRLGMSHLHAILTDIEKRLRDARIAAH